MGKQFSSEELEALKKRPRTKRVYNPKGTGGFRIYPWYELEIGDSFVIPNKTTPQAGSTVAWARKNTGRGFMTRQIEEGTLVVRTS